MDTGRTTHCMQRIFGLDAVVNGQVPTLAFTPAGPNCSMPSFAQQQASD